MKIIDVDPEDAQITKSDDDNTLRKEHPKRNAEEQTKNNHDLPNDEDTCHEKIKHVIMEGTRTVKSIATTYMEIKLQVQSLKEWI